MSQLTPTRCRICGAEFPNPHLETLVGDPNVKFALISQFCVDLAQHTMLKHRNTAQATELEVLKFGGLNRLLNFDISSPEVEKEMRDLAGPIVQLLTRRLPRLLPASFYFADDSPLIEIVELLINALKHIEKTIKQDPTTPEFRTGIAGEPLTHEQSTFLRYAEIALEVRDTANNALSLAALKMKPSTSTARTEKEPITQ